MAKEGIIGIVLAGGSSRRFGSDKLEAVSNGKVLPAIALDAVRVVADRVVVSHRGPRPSFVPHDVECVVDAPLNIGPVGGLHAVMASVPGECYLLAAGDMPGLTGLALTRLVEALESGCEAVVAKGPDGRRHPLLALYRRTTWLPLLKCIQSREYAMNQFLARIPNVRYVTFSADVLLNVNTPGDLSHSDPA